MLILVVLLLNFILYLNSKSGVAGSRVLVWNDEFDGTSINFTKWTREVLPPYTYNDELESYTNEDANSFVSGGYLTIRAIQQSYMGASYTSARLNTQYKGDWLYGRVEVRAKLPYSASSGTWPAIWMLSTDSVYGGWPNSGEIDIMEQLACDPLTIHGTCHTGAYNSLKNTQITSTIEISTDYTDFHVYALEWTSTEIDMFVDDQHYFTFVNDMTNNPATWPYNEPFFLILNIAVGGNWGGYCLNGQAPVLSTPQDMVIDYVRVYAPISCTGLGLDPYSSGSLVTCCNNYYACNRNWNGDGKTFNYLCTVSQASCNSGLVNPPTPKPTPMPNACTALGSDPYSSGSLIPCCASLVECLRNWNNQGNYYYLCTASQNACNNGTVNDPPATSSCTLGGSDPFSTGSLVSCCAGFQQCLNNWSGGTNYYYLCLNQCPSTTNGPSVITSATTSTNRPSVTTTSTPTTITTTACVTRNVATNSTCFQATAGNLQTGIGFAVFDETCISLGGGLGCIGTTGCRNCRLSNAVVDTVLPWCPGCVCVIANLDHSLCATVTTFAPTLSPRSPTADASTNQPVDTDDAAAAQQRVVMGGAIGGGVAALAMLAMGVVVYRRRRSSGASKRVLNSHQTIWSPMNPLAVGRQHAADDFAMSTSNPLFQSSKPNNAEMI